MLHVRSLTLLLIKEVLNRVSDLVTHLSLRDFRAWLKYPSHYYWKGSSGNVYTEEGRNTHFTKRLLGSRTGATHLWMLPNLIFERILCIIWNSPWFLLQCVITLLGVLGHFSCAISMVVEIWGEGSMAYDWILAPAESDCNNICWFFPTGLKTKLRA